MKKNTDEWVNGAEVKSRIFSFHVSAALIQLDVSITSVLFCDLFSFMNLEALNLGFKNKITFRLINSVTSFSVI